MPEGAKVQPVAIPAPEGAVELRAMLALPARLTGRPVVALHGCGGLGPAGTPMRLPSRERDWMARRVAAGHPALFPDGFGSRGLGEACGVHRHPAGAFGVRARDALASADWARAQPWAGGRAPALIGWSHGGSAVLAARALAAEGQIAGAVALYPGCLRAPDGGGSPLLMLLGGADDWTPPAFCERWLAGARGVTRIAYPDADHGFDRLLDTRLGLTFPHNRTVHYGGQPAARDDARARVPEFFAALP